MDLIEALHHAFDGESVLFVGAGFSRSARNLRGTFLKTAPEFASHLAALSAEPDEMGLEDAADSFIEAHGVDELIAELQQEFTVSAVGDDQTTIASVPWRRIYTTNYDNAVEQASHGLGISRVPVALSDDPRNAAKRGALCVHLNGYIDRINRENIFSEIKLTDTSYLTTSISDSPWISLFRQDLAAARSVFFIGYSAHDLDIRRILFGSERLKEKSFFILGRSADGATVQRAGRFGSIFKLDSTAFADALKAERKSYSPPDVLPPTYFCLSFFEAPQPESFSDNDVFDLLLTGDLNPSHVWHSIHGGPRYYCERAEVSTILSEIERGARGVVLHSDLGNGKSLIIEGVKCRALERGYEIVEVRERSDSIFREIDTILARDKPVLFCFDDYPAWLSIIEYIALNAHQATRMLLVARSSIHDVMVDALQETLGVKRLPEVGCDVLTEAEISWVADFLDEYGLWGEAAGFSRSRKLRVLRYHCKAEIHAILLRLFQSPVILSRFKEVIQLLQDKLDYYDVVLVVLILTALGERPSINNLADLCGESVFDANFRRHLAVRQVIDIRLGRIRLRSSVAAEYLLKNSLDPGVTIDVLVRIVRAAVRLMPASVFYAELLKKLMRFASIQDLLPGRQRRHLVVQYYESIKNIGRIRYNPLFWLQYAIACMVLDDYRRAERFFQTAYSMAGRIPDFDPYQIDNHYARFLLRQSIQDLAYPTAIERFRIAHGIVSKQIRNERLHYPYRVATTYLEFYETFSSQLADEHRAEIIRAATFVLERLRVLPEDRQAQRYVRQCEQALRVLVA